MRKLLTAILVVLGVLAGMPGTATAAAADPLGGGTILFNPFGQGGQCTAAFATVDARGGWYLVTERECGTAPSTQLYSTHSSGNIALVGTLIAAEPGYGIVRVTNTVDWELVSWIATGAGKHELTGADETPIGGTVCLIDHALGFNCGTVVAKNETITFPTGVITGLTRTNICASPRAVAFVTKDQAQGVPIGGSGICTTPGTSWFTPITTILAKNDLTLFTG